MVSVAVSTVVGASVANTSKGTFLCDDVIKLVPVLGAWVHPGGPEVKFVGEKGPEVKFVRDK